MPSKVLIRTFSYLELLAAIRNKKTRELVLKDLSKGNSAIFESLSEICKNIILGNIRLKAADKSKLKKYKNLIVALASKPKTKSIQNKLIVQSGDALPLLIPIVAGILGEYIGSKIFK